MPKTISTPELTGGGWSRAVLYLVTLAAAVWAGVAMSLGHESVGLAQAVVAVLAALTGGTATLNIAKAPDQHSIRASEVWGAISELGIAVKDLRADEKATPAPAQPDPVVIPPGLLPDRPFFDRD